MNNRKMAYVHYTNPQIDDIVLVKREDRGAVRIPTNYRREYDAELTSYYYRAKIIEICENKRFHRVQPLPIDGDISLAREFTRKAYKSKIYRIPV